MDMDQGAEVEIIKALQRIANSMEAVATQLQTTNTLLAEQVRGLNRGSGTRPS